MKCPRTACDDRFRRPAPLTLSAARRGCAQTVYHSHGRLIFLIGYSVVRSVVHDKISVEKRSQTNNYIVGSVGQLANFVIAVDSLRPALGKLKHLTYQQCRIPSSGYSTSFVAGLLPRSSRAGSPCLGASETPASVCGHP